MLELVTLRARPDLRPQLFAGALESLWPEFMQRDPTAMFTSRPHLDCYLDTAFAIIIPPPDAAVGRAFARAVRVRGPAGSDGAAGRRLGRRDPLGASRPYARTDRQRTQRTGDYAAAGARGQGASRVILDAMRATPVPWLPPHVRPGRPTAKHLEPFTPIGDYVERRTVEGLPVDPWLRVHIRAGGDIVKIAPASMVIPGSIAEWSRWASMRFTASGQIAVPGALVPVHVSLEQDQAVYVEPNVWVRHSIG